VLKRLFLDYLVLLGARDQKSSVHLQLTDYFNCTFILRNNGILDLALPERSGSEVRYDSRDLIFSLCSACGIKPVNQNALVARTLVCQESVLAKACTNLYIGTFVIRVVAFKLGLGKLNPGGKATVES